MTTVTLKQPTKIKMELVRAPGAERILQAFQDAQGAVEKATEKVLYFGFLMLEQRDALNGGRQANQHSAESNRITVWLERTLPSIPLRTAQRWMQAAERSLAAVGQPPFIEVGGTVVTASQILYSPQAEVPKEAQKYRQAWFDWAEGKTLKDCLIPLIFQAQLYGADNGNSNVFANYFTCVDTFGNLYPVAKPWNIRGYISSDDGGSITYDYSEDATCQIRIATGDPGGSPQTQAISPPYVDGQEIIVASFAQYISSFGPSGPNPNALYGQLLTDPDDPNYNTLPAALANIFYPGQIPITLVQVSPSVDWSQTS
jgi:hypothetical protein